ncbi:CaiB/BaiF CoA transferase family protein [Thermodesulfobacteriota bacterium]
MTMILDGVRVLDWTQFQQGPVSTMLLAELGADVIKIEEPTAGDPGRGLMRVASASLEVPHGDRNAYYEYNNRSKRGITLDLKNEEGQKIVYQLVEKSDVFVQNFRQGVAERLALDYETLRQHNPKLIYAHSSGWGPEGPSKMEPAFDYTGLARSGIMYIVGEPDMDPQMIQGGVADQTGAIMTALGVVSALFAREKHGIGQKIDVSLLGSMTAGLLGLVVSLNLISGIPSMRSHRSKTGNPLWNHYKCKDDKWIAVACIQADKLWPNLCRAMGLDDLEQDPRFRDMEIRSENGEELISIFDQTFASKTSEEWMPLFIKEGVIHARLNDITDLRDDTQMLANNYITEWEHPEWGKVKWTGFPINFSETPMAIRREAPAFGQHTEEILIEVLGYSWDDIIKLKDKEVI